MNLLRIFFYSFILCLFLLPGYIYLQTTPISVIQQTTDISTFFLLIFRLFGLYAFTLVWFQIMLGAFRVPLTRFLGKNILRFHIVSGIFTLIFVLLHGNLFFLAYLLGRDIVLPPQALSSYLGPNTFYGIIGAVAYYLMLVTTLAALLRKKPFLQKYWRYIHFGNYLVFLLAFIHSFVIGSDIQSPLAKLLYLFFAITYLFALMYKRLLPIVRSYNKRVI